MSATAQTVDSESYLDFYQRAYGSFLVERHLIKGKEAVGMFVCQQPSGDFPDDATSTYNLQLNISAEVMASADLGIGRHEMQMKSGDFVVAPARTPTDYSVYGKHRLMCLGIPARFFKNAAADLGISTDAIEALLTATHQDPVVRQIVKECWVEAGNAAVRGGLFLDASLMTLASRILGLAVSNSANDEAASAGGLSDQQYDRVCQYVDSNIDTTLRMKSLARLLDMNDYRFSRAFKARTGSSPYQWVIDRRLSRAECLLRQSTLPIAEIAFAVGFSSQSHMTALFRQRLGVTPAELRA